VKNSGQQSIDCNMQLANCGMGTDRVIDLLKMVYPEISALSDQENLNYRLSTISSKRPLVTVTEIPMVLEASLARRPSDRWPLRR
jgi:hypothetical protein